MNPGKIIFLNGVSSSGKSALARELQKQLTEDYFHLQLDVFIEMMPRTGLSRPIGYKWRLYHKHPRYYIPDNIFVQIRTRSELRKL